MLLFKEYFAVLEYHDFTSPGLKEGLPGTTLYPGVRDNPQKWPCRRSSTASLQLAQPPAADGFQGHIN